MTYVDHVAILWGCASMPAHMLVSLTRRPLDQPIRSSINVPNATMSYSMRPSATSKHIGVSVTPPLQSNIAPVEVGH